MTKTLIGLLFLFTQAHASTVVTSKKSGESAKDFAKRVTKSEIHQENQFGETDSLPTGKKTIVAFTEHKDTQDEPQYDLDLNVFKSQDGDKYSWSRVEACEQEGGSPTLRSFFYANADKSGEKAVGVICGWDARHASECSQHDEVRFFKVSSSGELSQINDKKFEERFYKKKKVTTDEKDIVDCTFSKFENAKDVKRILKEMGFTQK